LLARYRQLTLPDRIEIEKLLDSGHSQTRIAQKVGCHHSTISRRQIEPDLPDHGFTGTNRARPGLWKALAARRMRNALVVAKLDRLAPNLRDSQDTIDELTLKNVKLSIAEDSSTTPVTRLGHCYSTYSQWLKSPNRI